MSPRQRAIPGVPRPARSTHSIQRRARSSGERGGAVSIVAPACAFGQRDTRSNRPWGIPRPKAAEITERIKRYGASGEMRSGLARGHEGLGEPGGVEGEIVARDSSPHPAAAVQLQEDEAASAGAWRRGNHILDVEVGLNAVRGQGVACGGRSASPCSELHSEPRGPPGQFFPDTGHPLKIRQVKSRMGPAIHKPGKLAQRHVDRRPPDSPG